jgi:hypothetical protein
MVAARLVVGVAGAALLLSAGCFGGKGGMTEPSTTTGVSGTPPTFVDEAGRNLAGGHPAPIIVGGTTYLYTNTGAAGTSVAASPDGLTFSNVPAKYPAGISRTIVPLGDGRVRMYYLADGASVDVSSAVSSDGLNWTVEPGTRYTDPSLGAIRAIALPSGGYRIYYPNGSGLTSVFSADGLTFTSEGPVAITQGDSTFSWGASAAAYVNGQYHMVLSRTPTSTGISELWHAISADGRSWTVDRSVMAANPGLSINQPAWGINGTTARVYYRTVVGSSSLIASGVVKF